MYGKIISQCVSFVDNWTEMNSRATCVQRMKNYNIVCISGPNKPREQDFYYFANIKNLLWVGDLCKQSGWKASSIIWTSSIWTMHKTEKNNKYLVSSIWHELQMSIIHVQLRSDLMLIKPFVTSHMKMWTNGYPFERQNAWQVNGWWTVH